MPEEEETSYKELAKNRAITFTMGGNELIALNLPGMQALGLSGIMNTVPVGIGVKGEKAEENNWLVLMKDTKGIVKPFDVWAKEVGTAIYDVSGNAVSNVSFAVPAPSYETLIVDNEVDLVKAYGEGWSEPYHLKEGKWVLRKPK